MSAIAETVTMSLDELQVTNGAKEAIESGMPYQLRVGVIGTAPMLMHGWNIASINEKAASAKGSKTKKTDDLESYVYRCDDGSLGFPGVNFAAAIREAGRYMQDPRSPRKSAMDLCKAGVVPISNIVPFEPATDRWDYEDARRVVIQRAGITRIRPAMRGGWQLTFDLMITTPEYLSPQTMAHLISMAGRLNGLGDFRPTFGRFAVRSFEVVEV